MSSPLRVIDVGSVSAVRSQAVYHGVADAMAADGTPVLTLATPAEPYVCIGLHQSLEAEVDTGYCRRAGLPILRRYVGGGAVYLDSQQLFFHFIWPAARAPRGVSALYAHFVRPVLGAYRALGIPACLRPINDIHVHGRKIGGTGAAQIGAATVFVGSFLLDFDTAAMARCLRVPSEKFRDKLRSSLEDYMTTIRRELGSVPARQSIVAALLAAVRDEFGLAPGADALRAGEQAAVADWEARLLDPEFLQQAQRRRVAAAVKITGGVHLAESVYKAPGGLLRARVLYREGRLQDLDLSGDFTCFPASGIAALARALRGAAVDASLEALIDGHMRALGLDMPGVEPAHLAAALRQALPAEAGA